MGLIANIKGQKAYSLHGKGQLEEARRLYEEAVAGGLDNPRFLLAYSILLIRSGEYEKAKALLVKMQKLPTINAEQKTQLFVNYAACVYKLGELDKGLNLLRRQHQHQPSGILYQTLGYLYVEKYAKANEPDFDALDRAAALARQQAEEESAQGTDAEKPDEAPAEEKPAPLTAREQWQAGIDEAEAFLRESIEYDDEDPICLDNMGQFFFRVKEDCTEAKQWFDRAIALKDTQIDTLWFLSRYDLEAGDTDKAVSRLEKALEGKFSPLNYADKEMVTRELDRLKAQ